MSKEVKRYVATRTLPAASEWNSSTVPHTYVRAADYEALLAERNEMKAMLEEVVTQLEGNADGLIEGSNDHEMCRVIKLVLQGKLPTTWDALKKDAERYRWIECHADVDMRGHVPGDEDEYGSLSDMIDAALQGEQP